MDEIEILEYWKYSYFKVVLKYSAWVNVLLSLSAIGENTPGRNDWW